jgi:rhodanese-related sulfurtransferase
MNTIELPELRKKIQIQPQNFFLIDVRETEEFEAGHIPGSILIPWHHITERIKGIKKDTELILYCNSKIRAMKAAKQLGDACYENIAVYPGGWEEWKDL